MGGADQDMKFANSLSGEEGRRRGGVANINQSCRKVTPGIPFRDSSLLWRLFFIDLRAFSETCKVL